MRHESNHRKVRLGFETIKDYKSIQDYRRRRAEEGMSSSRSSSAYPGRSAHLMFFVQPFFKDFLSMLTVFLVLVDHKDPS